MCSVQEESDSWRKVSENTREVSGISGAASQKTRFKTNRWVYGRRERGVKEGEKGVKEGERGVKEGERRVTGDLCAFTHENRRKQELTC